MFVTITKLLKDAHSEIEHILSIRNDFLIDYLKIGLTVNVFCRMLGTERRGATHQLSFQGTRLQQRASAGPK